MYQFRYDDVMNDDEANARSNERLLFDQSIEMLDAAKRNGAGSSEAIHAYYYSTKLWAILMEDLGSPDNALPKELRANLISIGIFIMKELEQIRRGESTDYDSIIEITKTIRDGL
ncbi:MAG: flagellar biosynthesis regulator FlaF [Phyllobacterium sp.]